MARKVVAFDLDGTLVPSKATIKPRMANVLSSLLHYYDICVISGGKLSQFQKQLISNLNYESAGFARLHLLPTCGTQYYRFDEVAHEWQCVYAELLGDEERASIIAALTKGFHDLGYDNLETFGPPIDDRGGLITYSALGQDVVDMLGEKGLQLKAAWDPDGEKKQRLRDYIATLIPEFEVRIGSATSIDVTRPGVDKAYGMQKIMDAQEVSVEEIIYFGDRLYETGNDYPVKLLGIESIAVSSWEETAKYAEQLIHDAKQMGKI